MQLNTLHPAKGSKFKKIRVGRGVGSGLGKTCGRGHKGQKARAGGFHKVNFEGGQMPLQRRLPKFGFTSLKSLYHRSVRLNALLDLEETGNVLNLLILKKHGLVPKNTKTVRLLGEIKLNKAWIVEGITASRASRNAIESAGGKIIGPSS